MNPIARQGNLECRFIYKYDEESWEQTEIFSNKFQKFKGTVVKNPFGFLDNSREQITSIKDSLRNLSNTDHFRIEHYLDKSKFIFIEITNNLICVDLILRNGNLEIDNNIIREFRSIIHLSNLIIIGFEYDFFLGSFTESFFNLLVPGKNVPLFIKVKRKEDNAENLDFTILSHSSVKGIEEVINKFISQLFAPI